MPNYQHKFRSHQPTIYLSAISLSLILGIAHGLSDAAAGFLLGSLPRTMSLEQASWLIVLYNILGFGYQPFAGMLTDKFQRPRLAVLVGLFALLLALAIAPWHSQLAVILAGIGSAAFHVGGGALALTATAYRTTGPGIFAAPGAIGLALGIAGGLTGWQINLPIAILLGLMMAFLAIIDLSKYNICSHSPALSGNKSIENAELDDGVLLVLLSAIALISTVWTSFQFLLQIHLNLLIAIAFAAAIAKIFGGILAQRWGWRRYTIVSLTIAAFLLLFSKQNDLTLILGLALLQSSIPISLAATAKIMPRQPATASGLALGLAIILGGIPVMGGLSAIADIPAVSALMVVVSALLLWWVLRSKIMLTR
ncbi:MAG: MFS transporter [Oscillatoriaceae cyanobacterium Prado104]|jgi:FSR family fosmidomycin resistance protein-like MFS transporter|nr:MFS transporter [Oscillatoriaceae cyanobacterium Prado104]